MDVNIVARIYVVLTIIVIFGCGVALIRNDFVYLNRRMIADAIYRYHMQRCKYIVHIEDFEVEYIHMESYNSTFYRFWDWGYTRILPSEKFEIIKPFIK